jgi:hypothetical protein
MTRTVIAACIVVALVGAGCARRAGEQPAAQATAAQPATHNEQGTDPSVVATEDFETGHSETLQEGEVAAPEQPAEAP